MSRNTIGRYAVVGLLTCGCLLVLSGLRAQEAPTPQEVEAALLKAVRFFHSEVGPNGGYLWQYSGDLTLREAEGRITSQSLVWVQPPGTPLIGEAFLDAYEATGNEACLDAALDAAAVLVLGQVRTGGWCYSVELEPAYRNQWGYRTVPEGRAERWKRATILDDDTTPAAIRFLARLDGILALKDPTIHEAVGYALDSVLLAQYPNGSWFGWYEYYPKPFSDQEYPVKKASYPETWPRTPGESAVRYPARYILNDDVVPDMIRTLLDAWAVYREPRYLAAAKKAGDFLLLAQMPDPQPAWAQQYDIDMYPCWGRKFEPPAITAAESQTAMETLLLFYRRTGERKYLEAVPRALAYLKKSRLPDGQLSRFYELQTNRPLFCDRNYALTYSSDDAPSHYKWIWESRLDAIEAEYKRLAAASPASLADEPKPDMRELAVRVAEIIKAMDDRGAWVERGALRFHKLEPESGVINCQTFADNVHTLSQYRVAGRGIAPLRPAAPDLAGRMRRITMAAQTAGPPPRVETGDRERGPREGEGDRPRTGPREGDTPRTGPREGDAPRTGPREGDRPRTGPREGDAAPRTGPRDGDAAPREGPRDGDGPPETGPRDGDAAPRVGPRDGDAAPTVGSRDGEGPPKTGPRDGQ